MKTRERRLMRTEKQVRLAAFLQGVYLGVLRTPTVVLEGPTKKGYEVGEAIVIDSITGDSPGLTVTDYLETALKELRLNEP
jgi:hypothetical protein